MADFTSEEIAIIEASAPYQKFVKAYPEAGIEDFIAAQAKASKSFAFAKKYNKNLKPLDYFLNLKDVQRNQMLGEWTSPDANVPVLENLVKTEAKTEPMTEPQTAPQKSAPEPQPEIKTEPIVKPAQKEKEKKTKPNLKCDRKIDFETDKTFLSLLESIPQMQKDFVSEDGEEGLAKKQRVVDYYRFMQDGKKSREAIENQNWNFLEREYKFFPRASFKFLLETVYGNHLKKHGDTFPRRTERLQRTITYRFEDLWSGRNSIRDDYDLKAIEAFLSNAENGSDKEFAARLVEPTREAIAKYKEKKQKSLDEIIAHKNEVRKRQEEAEDKKRLQDEEEAAQEKAANVNAAKEKEDDIITINQVPVEKTDRTLENSEKKEEKSEIISPSQPELVATNENPETKENEDKKEAKVEDKKEKAPSLSWQEETEKSWLDYAEQHNKKARVTKEAEKLTVRLFADEKKVNEDKPETSIIYNGKADISIGGSDIDLSIFENIITQSKSISKKIRFGKIQDAEFSAKLMIACLRDKDIEMVNAPKPEELKDLKPELRELLDVELEKRGLKEPSEKGKERSEGARERINDRDQERPYNNRDSNGSRYNQHNNSGENGEHRNNNNYRGKPPYKKREASAGFRR